MKKEDDSRISQNLLKDYYFTVSMQNTLRSIYTMNITYRDIRKQISKTYRFENLKLGEK